MQTVKQIHELYDVYCAQVVEEYDAPLDYDQWLEQMLIASDQENDELVKELAMTQHMAEANHDCYVVERCKREGLEGAMQHVGWMLECGSPAEAMVFLLSWRMWN